MPVLTFSRTFPAYHPKAGQPTYFVEKIWESIYLDGKAGWDGFSDVSAHFPGLYQHGLYSPKHHTIRAGKRWKVGDKFSPRVWSGKPYQSKQIAIAPDIEVKKVWDFEIENDDDYTVISIDKWPFYEENLSMSSQKEAFETLAENDGLTIEDMKAWFKWPANFTGQIICWNENIEY